jgi:hypothetical protein
MIIAPNLVTPECFYRGSTVLTMILSPVEWVRISPVVSLVEPPLKACGNDGGLSKSVGWVEAFCADTHRIGNAMGFTDSTHPTIRPRSDGNRGFSRMQ